MGVSVCGADDSGSALQLSMRCGTRSAATRPDPSFPIGMVAAAAPAAAPAAARRPRTGDNVKPLLADACSSNASSFFSRTTSSHFSAPLSSATGSEMGEPPREGGETRTRARREDGCVRGRHKGGGSQSHLDAGSPAVFDAPTANNNRARRTHSEFERAIVRPPDGQPVLDFVSAHRRVHRGELWKQHPRRAHALANLEERQRQKGALAVPSDGRNRERRRAIVAAVVVLVEPRFAKQRLRERAHPARGGSTEYIIQRFWAKGRACTDVQKQCQHRAHNAAEQAPGSSVAAYRSSVQLSHSARSSASGPPPCSVDVSTTTMYGRRCSNVARISRRTLNESKKPCGASERSGDGRLERQPRAREQAACYAGRRCHPVNRCRDGGAPRCSYLGDEEHDDGALLDDVLQRVNVVEVVHVEEDLALGPDERLDLLRQRRIADRRARRMSKAFSNRRAHAPFERAVR